MNRNGRIVGGVLISLAVLWLLRIAGALPFSDRSTNQVAAQTPQDRPPIADFDASRTPISDQNPPTPTQPLLPGGNTPGNGSSTIGDSTQSGTAPDTTPIDPTTRPIGVPTTPVVRAGW
jgi:hypothetical protein